MCWGEREIVGSLSYAAGAVFVCLPCLCVCVFIFSLICCFAIFHVCCTRLLCSVFLVLPCSPCHACCWWWAWTKVEVRRGVVDGGTHEVLGASPVGGRWTGKATVNLACLCVQSPVFCRCLTRTSTTTGDSSKGCARGCPLSVWGLVDLAGTFAKLFGDCCFADGGTYTVCKSWSLPRSMMIRRQFVFADSLRSAACA